MKNAMSGKSCCLWKTRVTGYRDEMILERPILNKTLDERKRTFSGSKTGSRLVPCHEESRDLVAISNVAKDFHGNDKYYEELALIRIQLFQIEKQ
ncbi:hypothetical protein K1719_014528 [Acacia pycnantha]|nr:hypothetical protein K1719_014528 [Acacia pycnantha]